MLRNALGSKTITATTCTRSLSAQYSQSKGFISTPPTLTQTYARFFEFKPHPPPTPPSTHFRPPIARSKKEVGGFASCIFLGAEPARDSVKECVFVRCAGRGWRAAQALGETAGARAW